MDVHLLVAPVFGTNCTVVVGDVEPGSASSDRRDCIVVDAGAGVADDVSHLVDELGLTPRAVLATHGHVDHTWDAAELCERYDVPLRLHADDAYRLSDPFGSLGLRAGVAGAGVSSALTEALAATGRSPGQYRAPDRVEVFGGPGTDRLAAGAVRWSVVHAPGHTEGSSLYVLADVDGTGGGTGAGVVLAGDVLFAGGVGRTDLPGGDPEVMRRTLRDVVGRLDPGLAVVPGHGPTTTVGHELATNPFLR